MTVRTLYLATEAAAFAGVSKPTITNWVNRGYLIPHAVTVGGWPLYDRAGILAAMAHSKRPHIMARLWELAPSMPEQMAIAEDVDLLDLLKGFSHLPPPAYNLV